MIIFTDENIPPHLAPGFELIQKPESIKTGNSIEVKHLPEEFGYGTKDQDWIPELGRLKACVITRDGRLNRRKHEIELLRKHKIGVFFLKSQTKKSGMSVWQMVETLARAWPEVTKVAMDKERPFGYEINAKGRMKQIF
jgi:hypothetical protein